MREKRDRKEGGNLQSVSRCVLFFRVEGHGLSGRRHG